MCHAHLNAESNVCARLITHISSNKKIHTHTHQTPSQPHKNTSIVTRNRPTHTHIHTERTFAKPANYKKQNPKAARYYNGNSITCMLCTEYSLMVYSCTKSVAWTRYYNGQNDITQVFKHIMLECIACVIHLMRLELKFKPFFVPAMQRPRNQPALFLIITSTFVFFHSFSKTRFTQKPPVCRI